MAGPQHLEEGILEGLYTWIDQIPLSRPKRDLKRDFSDGVLVAEVVKHFIPSIVEVHNYSSALAVSKKLVNWQILNRKVFRKLGFEVNEDVIKNIVNCQPLAIEQFLLLLRKRIEQSSARRSKSDKPEIDQGEGVSPHGVQPRKAFSSQPFSTSHGERMVAAKMSANDNLSSGLVMSPEGIMARKKSFTSALPGDDLLRKILEEKDEQLKVRDEAVAILQAKIHRLEQLLQLKDIRIEDLRARLNDARTTNPSPARKKQGKASS